MDSQTTLELMKISATLMQGYMADGFSGNVQLMLDHFKKVNQEVIAEYEKRAASK